MHLSELLHHICKTMYWMYMWARWKLQGGFCGTRPRYAPCQMYLASKWTHCRTQLSLSAKPVSPLETHLEKGRKSQKGGGV